MLRDLRQVCERHGSAEPDDFRSGAKAVLKRQFLLLERPGDRDPYRLIANHFDYYANLFDALGWTLHRDDTFGLIGLLPGDAEGFRHLRLVDSLMLLCLRLLYEEGVERFEFYDRVREAHAIVVTGERQPWANFALRKGVLGEALRP